MKSVHQYKEKHKRKDAWKYPAFIERTVQLIEVIINPGRLFKIEGGFGSTPRRVTRMVARITHHYFCQSTYATIHLQLNGVKENP